MKSFITAGLLGLLVTANSSSVSTESQAMAAEAQIDLKNKNGVKKIDARLGAMIASIAKTKKLTDEASVLGYSILADYRGEGIDWNGLRQCFLLNANAWKNHELAAINNKRNCFDGGTISQQMFSCFFEMAQAEQDSVKEDELMKIGFSILLADPYSFSRLSFKADFLDAIIEDFDLEVKNDQRQTAKRSHEVFRNFAKRHPEIVIQFKNLQKFISDPSYNPGLKPAIVKCCSEGFSAEVATELEKALQVIDQPAFQRERHSFGNILCGLKERCAGQSAAFDVMLQRMLSKARSEDLQHFLKQVLYSEAYKTHIYEEPFELTPATTTDAR